MTFGKYPAAPPATTEEVAYISRDGYTVTITGTTDPDRWTVTSSAYVGDILRDGHSFRTVTKAGRTTVGAVVGDWEDLFLAVYP